MVAESSALMWRQVAERKRTAALRALPTKLTQHRSSRSSALRIPPKHQQRRSSQLKHLHARPQVTPCRIWDGGKATRALRPGESRPTMGLTPVPTRVGTGSLTQGRIVVSTEVLLPGLVPLSCRGVRWFHHPTSAQGRKKDMKSTKKSCGRLSGPATLPTRHLQHWPRRLSGHYVPASAMHPTLGIA